MAKLFAKLKAWRELMNAELSLEDPGSEAGRQAEALLKSLVESNLKHKGAHCFLGKRVPSLQGNRRHEIDLIVLTKKHIHILEVKNWSGDLSEKAGSNKWIQTKRNGKRIEHPNLIKINTDKRDAVIAHLKKLNVDLEIKYFSQIIMFMNKNLNIDANIAQDPAVIPYEKLGDYLEKQRGSSYAERFVQSTIELCLASESSRLIVDSLFKAMPKKDFNTTKQALTELETWDKVVLHGGRVLTGDILKLNTESVIIDLKQLPRNRQYPVKWTRSKTIGLLKTLFTPLQLGKIKLPQGKHALAPNDTIKLHLVGDPKPTEIVMKNISMLVRG